MYNIVYKHSDNLQFEIGSIVSNNKAVSTSFAVSSDWKTYRNEKHGFEFKYPQDWEIYVRTEDSNGSSYHISRKGDRYYFSGFNLFVFKNTGKLTADSYMRGAIDEASRGSYYGNA